MLRVCLSLFSLVRELLECNEEENRLDLLMVVMKEMLAEGRVLLDRLPIGLLGTNGLPSAGGAREEALALGRAAPIKRTGLPLACSPVLGPVAECQKDDLSLDDEELELEDDLSFALNDDERSLSL